MLRDGEISFVNYSITIVVLSLHCLILDMLVAIQLNYTNLLNILCLATPCR